MSMNILTVIHRNDIATCIFIKKLLFTMRFEEDGLRETPPTSSTVPLHIVYPTAAGTAPLVQSALHESRAD